MAIEVAAVAEAVALHFQQVEGVESVAHGLAVDEDIEGDFLDRVADWIRDGDDKSPAVDAGDFIALLADHEAAAVVLFLEAVRPAGEQARQLVLFDRVEELAADAAVASFVAGLLVGFGGLAVGLVALGDFRGDESC